MFGDPAPSQMFNETSTLSVACSLCYVWVYKRLSPTCSRLKTAAEILWIRSTTLSGSGGPSLLIAMSLYRFSCHLTAGSSD